MLYSTGILVSEMVNTKKLNDGIFKWDFAHRQVYSWVGVLKISVQKYVPFLIYQSSEKQKILASFVRYEWFLAL
jgi:hypothetical protein